MTSGSRPIRKTGSTAAWCGFTGNHGPAAAERGILGPPDPKLQYHDHFHTTVHGFRVQWELPDVLLWPIAINWALSKWKMLYLTKKPAHSSDPHSPSPCFGHWFHSSSSFKVQSSKINSYLQSGETQCALYTPKFDSDNYFPTQY